jgi:hypothetical protein
MPNPRSVVSDVGLVVRGNSGRPHLRLLVLIAIALAAGSLMTLGDGKGYDLLDAIAYAGVFLVGTLVIAVWVVRSRRRTLGTR